RRCVRKARGYNGTPGQFLAAAREEDPDCRACLQGDSAGTRTYSRGAAEPQQPRPMPCLLEIGRRPLCTSWVRHIGDASGGSARTSGYAGYPGARTVAALKEDYAAPWRSGTTKGGRPVTAGGLPQGSMAGATRPQRELGRASARS